MTGIDPAALTSALEDWLAGLMFRRVPYCLLDARERAAVDEQLATLRRMQAASALAEAAEEVAAAPSPPVGEMDDELRRFAEVVDASALVAGLPPLDVVGVGIAELVGLRVQLGIAEAVLSRAGYERGMLAAGYADGSPLDAQVTAYDYALREGDGDAREAGEKCDNCRGDGFWRWENGGRDTARRCPLCDGSGLAAPAPLVQDGVRELVTDAVDALHAPEQTGEGREQYETAAYRDGWRAGVGELAAALTGEHPDCTPVGVQDTPTGEDRRHRIEIKIDDGVARTTLICPERGCELSSTCGQCGREVGDDEVRPCYDCPTEESRCWLQTWAENEDLSAFMVDQEVGTFVIAAEFADDAPAVTILGPAASSLPVQETADPDEVDELNEDIREWAKRIDAEALSEVDPDDVIDAGIDELVELRKGAGSSHWLALCDIAQTVLEHQDGRSSSRDALASIERRAAPLFPDSFEPDGEAGR